MKDKIYYQKREFLNKGDSHDERLSAISTKVVAWGYNAPYNDEKKMFYDASLSISGCANTIEFDLEIEEDEGYENSLEKVETIIYNLLELKNAMIQARVDFLLSKSETKESEE